MIDTEVMRVRFKGNGETRTFKFPFKLNKASDLYVQTFQNGVLQSVSNFTIQINDLDYPSTGGTVTYPASGDPIGEDVTIIISRKIPLLQQDSYARNDTFSVENFEKSLDTLVQEIQQIQDISARGLHVPEALDVDTTLPVPEPGKSFCWDETGTKLIPYNDPQKYAAQAQQSAASAKESEARAATSATAAKAAQQATEDIASKANTDITAATNTAIKNINTTRDDAVKEVAAAGDASVELANKWAQSDDSPDGNADEDSPTGETQSSKSWALQSKESAKNAKTSESNAANSAGRAQIYADLVQNNSAPQWDPNKTYNFPDVVTDDDGYSYRAIAETTGEQPKNSPEKWVKLSLSQSANFWEEDEDGNLMPSTRITDEELGGNYREVTDDEIKSLFK